MRYEETLKIEDLESINTLLHTEPKDESECFGEENTITHTVIFGNGYEMDIKVCGVQYKEGENNLPWTEAVLFLDGAQISCSDVGAEIEGTWELDDDGNIFSVVVT